MVAAIILLAAGYIINFYLRSNLSTRLLADSMESYVQQREADFNKLASDSLLIARLLSQDYSKQELDQLVAKPYGILLYQSDTSQKTPRLRFWSDQRSVLPDSLLSRADGHGFVRLSNGRYELIKRTIRNATTEPLILVGLIPVRYEYYISSNNLKPEFAGFPSAENRVRISDRVTPFPVKNMYGNTLFYLERIESYNAAKYSLILLLLVCFAVLLILVVIHNVARSISSNFGKLAGIAFLTVAILVLRGVVYFFPDLFHLRQYELFDPSIYGSNYVLSSLGDLLINTLLFCWMVLFIKQELGEYSLPVMRKRWIHWLLSVLALVALLEVTFVFANIVQSLVADARISFNVTNFFSLTIYSFIGFVVLAALAFSYFFFSQILLRLIYDFIKGNTLIAYIIMAFTGLLLLTFNKNVQTVELDIFVLIWLLLYVWLMLKGLFSGLRFQLNVSEVLFWLFVFSLSISVIIIFENSKIEFQQRRKFAERLAEQRDPSSELLVSMSLVYFDNDFLYPNFNRFKDPVSNKLIKDSLISNNFSAYTDRYHTKIYTYDSLEKPLFNEDPVSFDTLNTVFKVQGKSTEVEDLKYYEKSFDKFTYIFKKTVEDEKQRPVGYLFILAEPKNLQSEGFVPELTRQTQENLPEYSPVYSYAIYSNNNLVYYYNDYPFPTLLTDSTVTKTDYYRVKRGSYDELWHQISGDKVVVIAKKDNLIVEWMTLFAYQFSFFLLLVALLWLVSILVQTRLHWSQLKTYLQLNIRSQIHTTIIFVSLFSFVVIGIATIFFFINRYNRNNQDRLSSSMKIVASEVQQKLPSLAESSGSLNIEGLMPKDSLELLLNNAAALVSTDINLYGLDGELLVSSKPFVYTKGILSNNMHPLAYYYMHQLNSVEYFNDEVMGRISYKSIYCPVREGSGRTVAYLNIPYFSTEEELHDEISKFLVTIINLNVFIFLIAGTIALFLTNRITSSFRVISEKMQRINLGQTIEVIEWKNNDEIGVLIKEYNKMVTKLEESATALAKSEREGAWREMARQVAHEIKNPLTPMKLSIQYLQKAIDNNAGNVKELTANVAKTLVEQIDHLAKIAADFSQFANIGNPKNEVFDLHDMLYSLTSLYETTENLLFKWVPVYQRIMVYADKTQLNRLFTNLLQNALEACHGQDKRVISISEQVNGETILLNVTDNGEGIPDSMHSKIFMPNFTTKSSGTGLGLAMSKTIIEQAKGKIWFETKVGEGTTFFVELPILRATT